MTDSIPVQVLNQCSLLLCYSGSCLMMLSISLLCTGSTGRPKGVMVSHASAVNTLEFEIGLRRKRGLGKDDPCIQMMSVFADMSGALEVQILLL